MFSDGIVDLGEAGVVTNRYKKVHPGRIATSFVMGTQRLYDFVHDNPFVEFYPCDHTNDTAVIRKNEHVVAINSALQVDLTGQICADSVGFNLYSGIGGQVDFIRGAAASRGGKPVLALRSTASGGTVLTGLDSLPASINLWRGLLIWLGVRWVQFGMMETSTVMGLPMAWVYAAMPAGAVVAIINIVAFMVESHFQRRSERRALQAAAEQAAASIV